VILVRSRDTRSWTDTGWRGGRHTVSPGNRSAPAHRAFGHGRIVNGGCIAPGVGVSAQSQADTGVLEYVSDGAQIKGVREVVLDSDHRPGILVVDSR
jgi:hypothetical protein